jgi:hypothetical protein
LTPGAIHHVEDLPPDLVEESLPAMNSLVSPWHQWLDPDVYAATSTRSRRSDPPSWPPPHGPIMTGDSIGKAFDTVRCLAGKPVIPSPGQALLDDLVMHVLTAPVG